MNMNQAEINNLKRQVHLLWGRVRQLENFTQPLAHPHAENETCGAECPAVPITEETLRQHKEAVFNAHQEIMRLRNELNAPKNSPHQKELDAYEREIARLREHGDHLEAKITELNAERNDQGKEIVELKKEREICLSNAVGCNQHVNELSNELQRVRKERAAFKYESDNQAAAWKEIKTFIPDYAGDGLSLVGMVRRYVSELSGELGFLKANNRYQSGYEAGASAVIKQVRDLAAKLKS